MNPNRQLGKTEALLLQAVEALREGNVAVVAATHTQARELFARLHNMGLSGNRNDLVLKQGGHWLYIVLPRDVSGDGLRGFYVRGRSNLKVFVDHFVFESGALR